MTYKTKHTQLKSVVLSADIGGTNFRLAAVSINNGRLAILHKETHSTPEIKDPVTFFGGILENWKKSYKITVEAMGIALAGPITNQSCQMTNANLSIDGETLSKALKLPVWLMNDLAGITWGTSLIDHESGEGIVHLGGPKVSSVTKGLLRSAVVAPGTGLGVGAMIQYKNASIVIDTEAGHMDFAPVNEYMRGFQAHFSKTEGKVPDAEQVVSGIGLENAYLNFKARNPSYTNKYITEIDETEVGQRGALISKYASDDEKMKEILLNFIEALARFSAGIGLAFIPQNGLYLAGGIGAKNIKWLKENDRFMKAFCHTYKENIGQLLTTMPVYLVDDNDIGLYGAAIGCILETQ